MFVSAGLKIERAKKHIADLKSVFDAFVSGHPHTLSISNQPDGLVVEVKFREELPSDLALILGDAVHNLSSALDHATWELIGRDGGTQDRWTTFPTGDTRQNYEATCKGIKTPRSDTQEFFIRLGAYEGGPGETLYSLHRLDNIDKHTILTPLARVASIAEARAVMPNGGVIHLKNISMSTGTDGSARLVHLGGAGMRIEFDKDADPTVDVFFRDIEFFWFKPIVPTLMQLSDAVTDTIGQFSEFVRTRP